MSEVVEEQPADDDDDEVVTVRDVIDYVIELADDHSLMGSDPDVHVSRGTNALDWLFVCRHIDGMTPPRIVEDFDFGDAYATLEGDALLAAALLARLRANVFLLFPEANIGPDEYCMVERIISDYHYRKLIEKYTALRDNVPVVHTWIN